MGTPWPAHFPQRPRKSGFNESLLLSKISYNPDVETLPMERERSSAALDTISMSFDMTMSVYRDFIEFIKVTLASGTLPFTLYDTSLLVDVDYQLKSSVSMQRVGPDSAVVSFDVRRLP